jgi:ribosomal protein S18 acetylase RimI-like enzyme
MNIRHLEESDYDRTIQVLDSWFNGRPLAKLLPKIFFIHFRPTSFALQENDSVIGFLAGFISQTDPSQAYIHFVAISPDHQKRGLGRKLYEKFFETVRRLKCTTVRCITSPVNTGSVAFHTRMGFRVEHVTGEYEGVPCTVNYELNEANRVLFVRELR